MQIPCYHKVLATSHQDSPNLDAKPRDCVVDDKDMHLQRGGVCIFGLSTARAVEKLQGDMTVLYNAWDTVLHGKNPEFLPTPWPNLWILGVCFVLFSDGVKHFSGIRMSPSRLKLLLIFFTGISTCSCFQNLPFGNLDFSPFHLMTVKAALACFSSFTLLFLMALYCTRMTLMLPLEAIFSRPALSSSRACVPCKT